MRDASSRHPMLKALFVSSLRLAVMVSLGAGCGSLLDVEDTNFGDKGGAGGASSAGGAGGEVGTGGAGATGATGGTGASGGTGATGGSGALGGGGSGGMGECAAPEDCPGVDTTCQFRTCDGVACGTAAAPIDTACTEDGGNVCDGQGACIECNDVNDCAATWLCQAGDCVPPQCSNGQQDGTESDVDCGGLECSPCPNTLSCNTYADCFSSFCDVTVCAPCINDGNCAAVTDSYCAGGTCTPKKVLGDSCGAGNQCLTGNCPGDDGVCCDDACGSTCEACLNVKTGSPNGACDLVTTQTDPDTECSDAGAATCDSNGMGCTGSSNGCILYPGGAVCIAPVCGAGQQTTAGQCNGTGTCIAGATGGCAPYVCNGGATACLTTCGSDTDCLGTHYCDGAGVCQQKKVNGLGCGGDNECENGSCPVDDGVCCDSACNGTCMSCTAARTGAADGVCDFTSSGMNPDGDCQGGETCVSGACMLLPPECHDVGGIIWCYHPTDCGLACNDICAAHGRVPMSDFTAWLEAQNTIAKCQLIADSFGIPNVGLNSYTHACTEASPSGATPFPATQLLCSTYVGCPQDHLTDADGLGETCAQNGRTSICPCE